MGVHIVPFQTLTRYHCHSHLQVTLSRAFLLSSPALLLVCANDGQFCSKFYSLGETLIVPSWFALNRVKMRSFEHFSLLLGIYHSDFFCRRGKGDEKLSYSSLVLVLQ